MSTPKPFVSNEQMKVTGIWGTKSWSPGLTLDQLRDIYEPHVQQLVRERDEALAKVEWISVEDRLPEGYQWVLVYSDTGDIGDFPFDIGRIIGGEWKCLGWDYPVTHWMPLPLSPNTPPSNG